MQTWRVRIRPAVLACAAVLELMACGRDEPPQPPAAPTRGLRADDSAPAAPPAAAPAAKPRPAPPISLSANGIPPATPPPPSAGPPDAGTATAPKRDYGGELKALVGSPSACLKPRPSARAPREINVTIEAVVMEGGMISRSYARSADLDEEELSCVRARLQTARMQPGIEQAPRTVSSTIALVLQPGPAPANPAATGAPTAAQPAAPSGYDQPEPQGANYDAPEPPPDLDQPEAPSPSDIDQPETALPALGAPVNPTPAPEQPQ